MRQAPPLHPTEWSPEVLKVIEPHLVGVAHVHDPFAGRGLRLGGLCDRLGITYTGCDIEQWRGADPRVAVGDCADPSSYPVTPFTIVTSPAYENTRFCDYPNGPTPNTKVNGRRDYGISLGRPLHPRNLARLTGQRSAAKREAYYDEHRQALRHWGENVIVNVDLPISDQWCDMLHRSGYAVHEVLPAYTKRYRGGANAHKRADHEVVIIASRRRRVLRRRGVQ